MDSHTASKWQRWDLNPGDLMQSPLSFTGKAGQCSRAGGTQGTLDRKQETSGQHLYHITAICNHLYSWWLPGTSSKGSTFHITVLKWKGVCNVFWKYIEPKKVKNIKGILPYDPMIPLLGICPKGLKTHTLIKTQQHYSWSPKHGHNPNVNQDVEYPYNGIFTTKRPKYLLLDTCCNADEPWKHYLIKEARHTSSQIQK